MLNLSDIAIAEFRALPDPQLTHLRDEEPQNAAVQKYASPEPLHDGDLLARFTMIRPCSFGLRLGFGHVRTGFGRSIVFSARTVVHVC